MIEVTRGDIVIGILRKYRNSGALPETKELIEFLLANENRMVSMFAIMNTVFRECPELLQEMIVRVATQLELNKLFSQEKKND